jgi:hypothetical protein
MPASRNRSTTRRSPRPAPRTPREAPVAERPLLVPFAGVFGLLVAVEEAYFAWLLSFGWYLVVPLVLALASVSGVVLVWWGRHGGWVVLAVAAVLPLLGLLGLAVLFGYLGGGSAFWSAVLLLVGPVGCLAITLQRPVRHWQGRGARTPSPEGRRAGARSG